MIINKIEFNETTKFIITYKGALPDRALEEAVVSFNKIFPQDSYIILSEDNWKILAVN